MRCAEAGLRMSFQFLIRKFGATDLAGPVGAGVETIECGFDIVEFDA
jgi:hypothetical protein